ncbi:flagellar basal-body rod protein FlgG [bacterium F16]|nr:flagellar basal-body rod protein FlgG [bacterium F16]
MNRALWVSATGMQSQQTLTETIAHNMANVNTNGYKRSVVHFQDLLYQNSSSPGGKSNDGEVPLGIQKGSGVRTIAISKSFGQGSLRNSSNALDMAIEGDGFFQVTKNNETLYTRTGNFTLNSAGQVVTPDGGVVSNFPTIDPNATAIVIAADGTVSITANGGTTNAGQIQLARFVNPEGLKAMGGNLYQETDSSGTATLGAPSASGFGSVSQYFLETSNVEIINEMVDMIAAQRAYELLSKGIKSADEMMRTATNIK